MRSEHDSISCKECNLIRFNHQKTLLICSYNPVQAARAQKRQQRVGRAREPVPKDSDEDEAEEKKTAPRCETGKLP